MKKIYLLFTAVIAVAVAAAQIPNAGFENWTSAGTYEDPDGWATMNSISVPNGHTSCEKSTDSHSGTYALTVTSNTSLSQMQGGWGVVASGGFNYPFKPAFPVSGNPTALSGWYKFNSLGGDSGLVMVVLFNQGTVVMQRSTDLSAAASWTPFSFDFDSYANADSGAIFVFAFESMGPNDPPNGNSSLWVDDLAFGAASGVQTTQAADDMLLFPNPAQDRVTIGNIKPGTTVAVYNMLGEEAIRATAESNTQTLDISMLPKGLYVLELKTGTTIATKRLIIQ